MTVDTERITASRTRTRTSENTLERKIYFYRLDAGQKIKRLSLLPEKTYRPVYGLFLYRTGKLPAAFAEFERLYRAAPADRAARGRLVAAYMGAGKVAEARKLLEACS